MPKRVAAAEQTTGGQETVVRVPVLREGRVGGFGGGGSQFSAATVLE